MITDKAPIVPMLGAIDYDPYLIQIVGLDSEWSRCRAYQDQRDAVESHREVCRQFQRNAKEIINRCCASPESTGLYKIMPFHPVGHADAMVMVLGDDIEALHKLVSESRTTIEEVTVGFCPVMKTLYESVLNTTRGWCRKGDGAIRSFAEREEIRRIFTNPLDIFESANSDNDELLIPPTPLVMLSSLKLGTSITLGMGLEMEHALCRAIIRSLLRTLHRIQTRDFQLFDQKVGLTTGDLASLRICLLDLQSQEQLGILFFTSNYSLAAALMSRMQGMTIADVLEEDAFLKSQFDGQEHLVAAIRRYGHLEPNYDFSDTSPVRFFSGTHVFRWTRSVAGWRSCHYTVKGSDDETNGWIETFTELQIPPGHQCSAEQKFPVPLVRTPIDDVIKHSLGRCDRLLHNTEPCASESGDWISTREFFHWHLMLLNDATIGKNGSGSTWRNLVGLNTMITVPTPISPDNETKEDNYYCPSIGTHHHAPFERILADLKQRIFLDGEDGNGIFSRNALEEGMKNAMLSEPLRRTIRNLFDNFVVLLTNPFLFDSVVELWDVFLTFHKVLADWPQNARSEEDGFDSRRVVLRDTVTNLAKFAGVVNCALERRLYRAFPEDRVRDVDIDFKGGLNQLVAAADTVQKCAIGILRYHVLERKPGAIRDDIGVLQFVGFSPGVELKMIFFPSGPVVRQLAVMRTDVAHLHHVPSFHDFWHEAFHLIQSVVEQQQVLGDWVWPPTLNVPWPSDSSQWEAQVIIQQRFGEVMAHVLTTLFISPNDPVVIGKHLAVQYGNSERSLFGKPTERFAFYLEKRLEWFVASDLILQIKQHRLVAEPFFADITRNKQLMLEPGWEDTILGTLEVQMDRARAYLMEMAPYHHEFAKLLVSEGETEEELVKEKTRRFLATIRPYMGFLLGISIEIYVSARKRATSDFSDQSDADDLLARMETIVAEMINGDYLAPPTQWVTVGDEVHQLDPAFLLCSSLRGILTHRIMEFDKCIASGKMIHKRHGDPTSCEYADFYCDPTQGGSLTCTNPELRAKRNLRYISVLKACEGISSTLRSRRVTEIISVVERRNAKSLSFKPDFSQM